MYEVKFWTYNSIMSVNHILLILPDKRDRNKIPYCRHVKTIIKEWIKLAHEVAVIASVRPIAEK